MPKNTVTVDVERELLSVALDALYAATVREVSLQRQLEALRDELRRYVAAVVEP